MRKERVPMPRWAALGGLVAGAWTVRAHRFVRHIATAAFDAIVDGNLADRTDGFVVESRDAQGGAELFIEAAQILQM